MPDAINKMPRRSQLQRLGQMDWQIAWYKWCAAPHRLYATTAHRPNYSFIPYSVTRWLHRSDIQRFFSDVTAVRSQTELTRRYTTVY